jgi:hypothetical protein
MWSGLRGVGGASYALPPLLLRHFYTFQLTFHTATENKRHPFVPPRHWVRWLCLDCAIESSDCDCARTLQCCARLCMDCAIESSDCALLCGTTNNPLLQDWKKGLPNKAAWENEMKVRLLGYMPKTQVWSPTRIWGCSTLCVSQKVWPRKTRMWKYMWKMWKYQIRVMVMVI